MRVVQPQQMTLGEMDISQIVFDKRSWDDIPKVLRGLQQLYLNEPLRKAVFALLEAELLPKINKATGRPGMPLWTIFVCAVLRLDLNADYDRIHELANQHGTLRQMLGHGPYNEHQYSYQSLVDNLSLFTPELLDKINTLIVQEGHVLVKKGDAALRGRCDSFVVETNVHYPTDISLLWDALRQSLTLMGRWSEEAGLSDWRQYRHNLNTLKRLVHAAQNQKRRCTSKGIEAQADAGVDRVKQTHQTLLARPASLWTRSSARWRFCSKPGPMPGVSRKYKALSPMQSVKSSKPNGVSCTAKSSRMKKKSSPFFSPIPNGSAKGKPAYPLNWAFAFASWKMRMVSSCTTG